MSPVLSSSDEQRILLKTATAKDAKLAVALLRGANIDAYACASAEEFIGEAGKGAGALLIAEEMLADPAMAPLNALLRRQAPWSDLPILVVAGNGAVSNVIVEAMDMAANITVIERPISVSSLISTARSALRARERQYQLRSVLDGLHEADQRKTEFLATLAHELRNPLAPLNTALSILTMKPHSPEAARPHYEMMQRQVRHMVRLIDDLMEVSRITRGKIELKMDVVALDRVIEDAIELSRPALEFGAHRLHVSLNDDDWRVRGDRVRLTQVFSNILNNAAKYTPRGGRIQIEARRDGDNACVTVSDNGVGVPAEMLGSIFDMFVQVGDVSRAGQGGLGIGLTLVKSLVELHGGSVRAASAGSGKGTQLSVTLPLLLEAARRDPAVATRTPAAALSESVLIVDDNSDAADALSTLLRVLGARTIVAYDAATALKLVAENDMSVAILDIGMPGMDGCELARCIRSDARHANVMLVALTGWGQPDDRQRVTAAGFDHHFLKPVDTAALIATLQQRRGAPAQAGPAQAGPVQSGPIQSGPIQSG